MKKEPPKLTRSLFWETDYDQIDWEGKARYVIERVVMYGFVEDWRAIQEYYGMDKIREAALACRDFDPKTLSFLSTVLGVPKQEFRCYATLQSNPGHWVY